MLKIKLYSKKKADKKYLEKNFLINSESKNNIIKLNNKIQIPLELINEINEVKLDQKLEEDLKSQIINYNNEPNAINVNANIWISSNKNNIKKNSFRGKVYSLFNSINKKITGYDIRPIQLISLLLLTKNEPKSGGIFLQINTGEGKSLIIQFLAAYLAILGNKVDIITSSSILA